MSSPIETLRDALANHGRVLGLQLETLSRLDVSGSSDEDRCDHVAATLSRVYTAIENILRAIAVTFDEMPSGDRWHRDLLEIMTRQTELRPAVISSGAEPALTDLLEFRHYFIHGSIVTPPQGARLAELKAAVLALQATVLGDLAGFDAHLGRQ